MGALFTAFLNKSLVDLEKLNRISRRILEETTGIIICDRISKQNSRRISSRIFKEISEGAHESLRRKKLCEVLEGSLEEFIKIRRRSFLQTHGRFETEFPELFLKVLMEQFWTESIENFLKESSDKFMGS